MSKRFTETDKWRDPWFRKLSALAKLLFLWLVDNCDKAGVVDLDLESASFDIGQPVNGGHLSELQSRWNKLSNGKIRVMKFIAFQYGPLSEKCTPHLRVIETLRSHGISYPENAIQSPTLHTTLPATLQSRVQDKRGKEGKRGEPEKRGAGEGGTGGNGELDAVFVRDLMATYHRAPDSRLTFAEQCSLAEIIRERTDYRLEFDALVTFKQRQPKYFPQSLEKLLTNWQQTLDRAANWTDEKTNSDHKEIPEVIHIKEL